MSTPTSLIHMPNLVMEHIFEYLDFPSILMLRKVCHDLRNFIDVTKPASRLTDIRINVYPEYILCTLEPQSQTKIRIFYEKCSEGCLVKKYREYKEIKRTILDNEDFVTVFFKDFDIILRHQKTVLKIFGIGFNSLISTILKRVLESVQKSFKCMNHLLQVESLRMTVNNHDEIMSILPYIDPKPLKLIGICESSGRYNVVLNFNEIGLLEQWKQVEILVVDAFQIPNLYQHLKHFSKIFLFHREVSFEDMIMLKEIFLSSSTLTAIEVQIDGPFCDFHTSDILGKILIEAFGEPLVGTNEERKWFFRISDTNQLLKISLCYRDIHFFRIDQSDVPQNSLIQN